MELETADQKILVVRSVELNPCGSDGQAQTPNVNCFLLVVFGMAGRALYSSSVDQIRKKPIQFRKCGFWLLPVPMVLAACKVW